MSASKDGSGVMRGSVAAWFFLAVLLLMPLSAWAEPWIRDVSESEYPVLKQAFAVDLEGKPAGVGDQKTAESLYLQYIKEHPTSEVVPYLYYRLAHNYSTWVTPARGVVGAVADPAKAREYFQKTVASYPKDKVGSILLDAEVSIVATATTPDEVVHGYIAHYKRLEKLRGMDSDQILQQMWFSKREVAIAAGRKDYKQNATDAFRDELRGRMEIEALNMVSAARHSGAKLRSDLLRDIMVAFPDTQPGVLARAAQQK